jgi:hypothetical protein
MYFIALALAAFVAGCGSGGDDGVGSGLGPTGAACAGSACVSLGTAANYVILSKSGISTVPVSAVTGNLGVSPAAATAITGFSLTADASNVFSTSPQVTGRLFAANYARPTPSNLTTAVLDMETAYTAAAGSNLTDAASRSSGPVRRTRIVAGSPSMTAMFVEMKERVPAPGARRQPRSATANRKE